MPVNTRNMHAYCIQLECFNKPIVDINVDVNASSEKRNNMQVFPTPESPINNNLNNKS